MRLKNWIVVGAGALCATGAAHATQTTSYSYDALGRLTQVQSQNSAGTGTTQHFQYDNAGNRKQYQVLAQVAMKMNDNSVVVSTPAGSKLTVSLSDPSATGTVTFSENGTVLGSASVANGQATVILQGYGKGTHTIVASYSGDGTHVPSSTTFTITVRDLSWLPAVLQLLLNN